MSVPFANVATWLSRRALLSPDHVALEVGSDSFTYRVLDDRVARAAGALAGAGVARGDRVALALDNSVAYVESFLACAALGAIAVPISTRLTEAESRFLIEDAGCSLAVADPVHAGLAVGEPLKDVLLTGSTYDAARDAADPIAPIGVGQDDVVAIFYTSGTTGRPKGAMLTHGNFFWTNLNMVIALGLTEAERSLVVLPMFHVGGWNINTLSVWLAGGTVVLTDGFDAPRALATIADRRVTLMMGVPAVYAMLADDPGFAGADLDSLRLCVCGGAPLPVSLIERYRARRVPFTQGYGLTEAAPNCLFLPPEDAVAKAGAAGRPYFFVDVQVVDDDGRPVAPGGTGEVVVAGPSVMAGYWGLPEESAEALRDGWLHTGDVGRIDADGVIWIVDRLKDMYISGGENVYPAEVEKVLHAHPAIAEAAVIGIPDERWGEVGRAIVVARDGAEVTADEVRSHCAEHLAKFKVPADVVFTDVLPRNATGKLLKPAIREAFGGSA